MLGGEVVRADPRGRARGRGPGRDPARRRRGAQRARPAAAARRAPRRPARRLRARGPDRPDDEQREAAERLDETLGDSTTGPTTARGALARPPARMIRLAVRCAPEHAERVLADLLELAPNGLEEERGPGWVEYAIYGPPGEVPELGELAGGRGRRPGRGHDDRGPRRLGRPLAGLPPARSWSAGRIGVRPSWGEPQDGLIDVVVDPGRAFGTGAHPTTRICLELLLELDEAGEAPGAARGLGHRLGRARDRRREARLVARSPAATTSRRRSRRRGPTRRPTGSSSLERVNLREEPAAGAPTVVANLTGTCSRTAPATSPAPARRRDGSSAPGCWGARSTRWPAPSPRRGLSESDRRDRGRLGRAAAALTRRVT